jgi:hypothetical protein
MTVGTVECIYFLKVFGNQTQANLAALMATVPLDLSIPQIQGLIPTSDATSNDSATLTRRTIFLGVGTGVAPITAQLWAGGRERGRIKSITLGSVSGYFSAVPIISFSAPQDLSGQKPSAHATMGVGQILIANGGTGYHVGTTTAKLVGGNLLPGGTPATLGAITANGSGTITSVAVATLGSGYTTYPTVVFTDTNATPGSGATAYGGLQVTAVTLDSPGGGYSVTPPTVTVTPLYTAQNPIALPGYQEPNMPNWMTNVLGNALRSPILAAAPIAS